MKFKKISAGLIVFCVVTAIGLAVSKHHFLSSVIEADGKIISFQKSPDPDDDYATPVLEFEYQKQTKTIINPFMVNDALFQVNQVVPVIFDPQNPENAQMKTAAFQYFPTATLILCAILLGIIHWLVFKNTEEV